MITLPFLCLKNILYTIPTILMAIHDSINDYLRKVLFEVMNVLTPSIAVIFYMVNRRLTREVSMPTDKYVMDRATLKMENTHGDKLSDVYEIIKVHEVNDVEEKKEEDVKKEYESIERTDNAKSKGVLKKIYDSGMEKDSMTKRFW